MDPNVRGGAFNIGWYEGWGLAAVAGFAGLLLGSDHAHLQFLGVVLLVCLGALLLFLWQAGKHPAIRLEDVVEQPGAAPWQTPAEMQVASSGPTVGAGEGQLQQLLQQRIAETEHLRYLLRRLWVVTSTQASLPSDLHEEVQNALK